MPFYSLFFPNLKPIFFIFSLPPQSSRRSPFLTLPLGLSFTHSHGLTSCPSSNESWLILHGAMIGHCSLFAPPIYESITSHSRGFSPQYLTVSLPARSHGLDLSPSHRSGSRSHRRLSLLLAISPSPHACDLTATATARPRSLSPTDPAKGHGTPIKLSLSLTPTVKFWSTGCFSFSPYFPSDLVSTGLLVCWCKLYEVLIFIYLYLLCFWIEILIEIQLYLLCFWVVGLLV